MNAEQKLAKLYKRLRVMDANAPILVKVSAENSTVDGHDWLKEGRGKRFAALDFSVHLFIDDSYREGCIKYVPCGMDDDPTCGHRVRSKFPKATPIGWAKGEWYWLTARKYNEKLRRAGGVAPA